MKSRIRATAMVQPLLIDIPQVLRRGTYARGFAICEGTRALVIPNEDSEEETKMLTNKKIVVVAFLGLTGLFTGGCDEASIEDQLADEELADEDLADEDLADEDLTFDDALEAEADAEAEAEAEAEAADQEPHYGEGSFTAESTTQALTAPSCVRQGSYVRSGSKHSVRVFSSCSRGYYVRPDVALVADPACKFLPAGGNVTFYWTTSIGGSVRGIKRC